MSSFLSRWHKILRLPRQSASWHRDRLQEELEECRRAVGRLQKISETADVMFTISRAYHQGSRVAPMPRRLTASWSGVLHYS